MARTCSVCEHPERAAIDRALVTRAGSMRNIAERFGLSTTALSRHKSGHIPRLVQAARAEESAEAVTSGRQLTEALDSLRGRAQALLDKAEGAGELRTALAAIREIRETIKAQHELTVTAELEARLDELERQLAEPAKGSRGHA